MPSSDLKNSTELSRLSIGGQAIIEGVMMRSPHFYVMAVRGGAGEIVVESREYISLTQRSWFWKWPLLRGVAVLFESLMLGMKALMFSNDIMMAGFDKSGKKRGRERVDGRLSEQVSELTGERLSESARALAGGQASSGQESKPADTWLLRNAWLKTVLKMVGMILYFVFVFGVAIFLFKFLPLLAAEQASRFSRIVDEQYFLFNLIDGVTKVVVFLAYILLISLLPDIRRVFAYHGAEHQAIWAYEKKKTLTVENAQAEHPEHPRCGTSFIVLVLLLSVLIYTVLPSHASFGMKLFERVLVLPFIAGLSYEVLKVSAKYERRWWMHWVTVPGLWLQKITTKKPTDDMEEVALAALSGALAAENEWAARTPTRGRT